MKVNFYTSQREYHEKKNEFDTAIQSVIEKGNFILGDKVAEFEKAIEEYTGIKHAIGVASGTDALVIASDILGFSDGAEVITSPFTFLARSEEHTSELQSRQYLVCRLLLEKKNRL